MRKTIFAVALLLAGTVSNAYADRKKYNFNSCWQLCVGDFPDAKNVKYDDSAWKHITLPHAFNEDEAFKLEIREHTDTVVWYRKHFRLNTIKGRKVFIEFEGVRQGGDFFINGHHIGQHENGVMAVGFDLTPYIKKGENVIAVRLDNSWDYQERSSKTKFQWNDRNFNANYGGLPKNVFLHITDDLVYQTLPLFSSLKTTGVYVYASNIDIKNRQAVINAESEVRNDGKKTRSLTYEVSLTDADGQLVKTFNGGLFEVKPGETRTIKASSLVDKLHFWSWGYGYLYNVKTILKDDKGHVIDEVNTRTGFRKTRFEEGKVWLNDRVIQFKGYAQRTSNEWPAVGLSVPAWLSDYSNGLMVKSNGNIVRWMHVTPWKQDVESCDRVGLIQAMPAGDAEKDREGRQWEQRMELMRDAIIYNRNNPSILFYECGNFGISNAHMKQMKAIRDEFDPHGGRAIGSREMLGDSTAEYGGEMLYINKSAKKPFWAMEYCRDEGIRKYWDDYSFPFHKEGVGRASYHSTVTNTQKKIDPEPYNHNQDEFAVEMVRRWFDYWRERPGQGQRVSSGGAKIIFSDSNTHFRGEENYRTSGVTDALRIPKDAFFAHQVMWNGWVDTDKPQTYIIGHWNYKDGTVKPVHVVSNADSVRLTLNGQDLGPLKRRYNFLFTADSVAFKPGKLKAISYNKLGKEVSSYELNTADEPAKLRLTTIQNPEGFHADGADLALVQVEVVDKNGRRCPLDNRLVKFTLTGEAEWRGGIAQGKDNYILAKTLPVECGVNRVILRSTTKAGAITLKAEANGLPSETIELATVPVEVDGGLSEYLPQRTLKGHLDRGETPTTPSYTDHKRTVKVIAVTAGANAADAKNIADDNEETLWQNDGKLETAWITVTLEHEAAIDDVCLKLSNWRSKSYPLEIFADDVKVWNGVTEKSLGYVHISIPKPVKAKTYTVRLTGSSSQKEAFGAIVELAGGAANKMDRENGGKNTIGIVETDFLETLPETNNASKL